tara:strand:- start:80 stop:409 length:330 start_codon:yes stop_codon:yes gene_type:complete
MGVIENLSRTIETRLDAQPKESYVASLHAKGTNKIIEKVSEETTELLIAAKDIDKTPEGAQHLVDEVADLWFHSMVLLAHLNVKPDDVLTVLEGRFGESGHQEKARRAK